MKLCLVSRSGMGWEDYVLLCLPTRREHGLLMTRMLVPPPVFSKAVCEFTLGSLWIGGTLPQGEASWTVLVRCCKTGILETGGVVDPSRVHKIWCSHVGEVEPYSDRWEYCYGRCA